MQGDTASTARIHALLAAAVAVFLLLPFVGKPFHMDDPLFLWAARQIRARPLDPYGFDVNWYGWRMPMWEVTKNPPGASYLIALASLAGGWSEVWLHLVFLLPAIATAVGVHVLARQLCREPQIAAMAAVLTPAFLVSSTNVMCDTLLLAFWVWAVVLWHRGLQANRWRLLLGAGVLISLAGFTKYFGVALLPLLFAHGLLHRRRLGTWMLALAVPVVACAAYDSAMLARYGHRLLSEAIVYSNQTRALPGVTGGVVGRGLVALSFAGGCLASALFLAPVLWSRRACLFGLVALLVIVAGLLTIGHVGTATLADANGVRWLLVLQLAVCVLGGAHILALVADDVVATRDADSVVLGLWVLGTLLFTAYANWGINVRSLLPAAPAVAILVARRLDRHATVSRRTPGFLLALAGALALAVCAADYGFADTTRAAARLSLRQAPPSVGTLWFQGHWGFQYYMETGGARAMERHGTRLMPGDEVVIPEANTNLFEVPRPAIASVRPLILRPLPWIAALDFGLGAGFYADLAGPLPFAFGPVTPMRHVILTIGRETELR